MAEAPNRFERERAAWVLSHAGHNAGARRRGQLLAQRAARASRERAGAGDLGAGEVVTRNWFHRLVHREEGVGNQLAWMFLGVSWAFWYVVLYGVAWCVSWVAYGAQWWAVPARTRRVKAWPSLLTAVLVAGVSWLCWAGVPVLGDAKPEHLGSKVLYWFLVVQVVLGLVRAAAMVRRYGWPGVPKSIAEKPAAKSIKDRVRGVTPGALSFEVKAHTDVPDPVIDEPAALEQVKTEPVQAPERRPVEEPAVLVPRV